MYGAEWCSHCKNQKKLFGNSFQYVNYVDCDKNSKECKEAGISGYPTWKVNGQNYSGTTTDLYGTYGRSSVLGGSVTTGYGIYGSATGATTNWAWYFDDGNVYIENSLGVGTSTPNGYYLNAKLVTKQGTSVGSTSSDLIGIAASSYSVDSSNTTAGYFSSSAEGTGNITGVRSIAISSFGSIPINTGISAYARTLSGSTTSQYGVNVETLATNSSTVGTNYGININTPTITTSTVNTNYGLYIANQTGATTNYSIYSAGGNNYFGGNVGIGVTSPASNLHIVGGAGGGALVIRTGSSVAAGVSENAVPMSITYRHPSATNIQVPMTEYSLQSAGGGALVNGTFGPTIGFSAVTQSPETNNRRIGTLGFVWANVVDGTRASDFVVNNVATGGTLQEVLRINALGSVGIGTTSPATKLAVVGGVGIGTTDSFANAAIAANNLAVQGSVGIGVTAPAYAVDVKASGTGVIARFNSDNVTGCTLDANGTISCSSDASLKKNVNELGSALTTIGQLNPVSYNWNYQGDGDKQQVGFLAQEVEGVLPGLVSTDITGYKQLNTIGMVPYLVKAIQELNDKIQMANDQSIPNDQIPNMENTDIQAFQTDITAEKITTTDLTVLGNTLLAETTITGGLNIGLIQIDPTENSIDAVGTLKIQPLALGDIEMMNGKVTIDENGNISIAEGKIAGNSTFRDKVVIDANVTSMRVDREWDEVPFTVVATAAFDSYVWVSEIDETGFTIHINNPLPEQADQSSTGEVFWQATW